MHSVSKCVPETILVVPQCRAVPDSAPRREHLVTHESLSRGLLQVVHPPNKFDVALRVARQACHNIYGFSDMQGGPTYRSAVR